LLRTARLQSRIIDESFSILIDFLSAWTQDTHPILALGSPVPNFKLPGVDGKTHTLSDCAASPILLWSSLDALEGTDFFQALGDGSAIQKDFDVLGIFTIDSLSVIKTLDVTKEKGWTEVSIPIAIIVFGQTGDEP
jgi:hypothetical protein